MKNPVRSRWLGPPAPTATSGRLRARKSGCGALWGGAGRGSCDRGRGGRKKPRETLWSKDSDGAGPTPACGGSEFGGVSPLQRRPLGSEPPHLHSRPASSQGQCPVPGRGAPPPPTPPLCPAVKRGGDSAAQAWKAAGNRGGLLKGQHTDSPSCSHVSWALVKGQKLGRHWRYTFVQKPQKILNSNSDLAKEQWSWRSHPT